MEIVSIKEQWVFNGKRPFLETAEERFLIFLRDEFRCVYCNKTSIGTGIRLNVDHIIPLSEGGKETLDNLATACSLCNAGKYNSLLPYTLLTSIQEVVKKNTERFNSLPDRELIMRMKDVEEARRWYINKIKIVTIRYGQGEREYEIIHFPRPNLDIIGDCSERYFTLRRLTDGEQICIPIHTADYDSLKVLLENSGIQIRDD